MVPSTTQIRRERLIQMKATKEEYLNNLRELAAQKEEEARRSKMEEEESAEEFEALARETSATTSQNDESVQQEFSEIIDNEVSTAATIVLK
jgi:hypothetical protein